MQLQRVRLDGPSPTATVQISSSDGRIPMAVPKEGSCPTFNGNGKWNFGFLFSAADADDLLDSSFLVLGNGYHEEPQDQEEVLSVGDGLFLSTTGQNWRLD